MSLKRWNARRDANEKAIVEALEAAGAIIFRVSEPGAPDLLVGFRGRWLPMEVKTLKGKLTPLQWGSYGACAYPVVRTPDEALRAIGAVR